MASPSRFPGSAGLVARFVYGDASLDEWVPQDGAGHGEPWPSFEQASHLARAGQMAEATEIWQRIASSDGLESRQTLQAWHFLRQAGLAPPPERARLVLGVVAEMPVGDAHDLLAAYRDESARYLNYSGSALVLEDRSRAAIRAAIGNWIAIGQVIADAAGPWEQPSLPPLPTGNARVMALTPGGPRFGQGPAPALSAEPLAATFVNAATALLRLLLNHPD